MPSMRQGSSDVGEPRTRRPVPSRSATANSRMSYIQQPESFILPDGAIGAEAAELLEGFVNPQHQVHAHIPEETLVGSDTPTEIEPDDGLDKRPEVSWWKKPSPWWLLALMPFTAIATSATIAPRIEIYTMLACSVHRPDIFREVYPDRGVGDLQSVSFESVSRFNTHAWSLPNLSAISASASPFNSSPETSADSDSILNVRPPKNLCAADPVVAGSVAKLTAVISTWMGFLSIMTTGWWGAFSDRYGRTRVMGIFILSLLFNDFNFLTVAKFSKHLPGGYWLLVIGPSLEGLLGGMTTGMAASHGYLADTTTEGTRTRVFSLYLGLHFTGMALGSTLGSLLIRFTGQILSVYYLSTVLHLIYTILVWTIVPESLTQEEMKNARENYAAELLESVNSRAQNPRARSWRRKIKRVFKFLDPLTVFKPILIEEKYGPSALRKPRKDYNLTLVAIAYGATISLMGSYSYKFQYAESTFNWSTTTIGYWVSLTGAARAIFLTVILPMIIGWIKPKPVMINFPARSDETTPLLEGTSNGSRMRSVSSGRATRVIMRRPIHSPTFDLGIAQVSLIVEIIGYLFMGLAPTGWVFMVFGVVGSFGTGFSPAVQSVVLSLYARRGGTEIGRLYGALSVIQALCSQILGPTVYAFVFVKTFRIFPPTIFFVSALCVTTSLIMLSLVRLPNEKMLRREGSVDLEEPGKPALATHHDAEGTLVGT